MQTNEQPKRLGIICAMQIELTDILAASEDVIQRKVGSRVYYEAKLSGCEIVATVCGIGKVNAASTTQELISVFAPAAVVNSGIAGALDDDLLPGDIILATGLVYHDFDLGYFTQVPSPIPTDSSLIEMTGASADTPIKRGIIASGDAFVSNTALKNEIVQRTRALAVDMESAAVAQVAHINDVPSLIIRSISDMADDEAEETYDNFEARAAARSAALLVGLAGRLAKHQLERVDKIH